jgi:rare lipoprotein A
MNDVGELQSRTGRKRSIAGVLAVTLGLSATLVASPTVKRDIALSTGNSTSNRGVAKRHWYEIGRATWYGGSFNGRQTANGETYDMYGLTCAHRTLPFGSWLRVKDLKTRKTLLVRVNDRGPMSPSILVDLSYGAARKLGISGNSKVSVEEVKMNDPKVMQEMVSQLHLPKDPALVGLNTEVSSMSFVAMADR